MEMKTPNYDSPQLMASRVISLTQQLKFITPNNDTNFPIDLFSI